MKRKHSEHKSVGHLIISTLFNFNWHQCECCKLDFRYESGWNYLTGPFYGSRGVVKYLCKKCKPTRNDVIDFIEENKLCLKC